MSESVKMRQRVERMILRAVVRECLQKGYALNVYNGGDEMELPEPTTSLKTILDACMAADEDRLWVCRPRKPEDGPPDYRKWDRRLETPGWRAVGWVLFVYGNSGWNVVSDHTVNLQDVMGPAEALTERYGG